MGDEKDNRTLSGLVRDLMRDTAGLFRQEVQLAKTEISEKISHVGSAVAAIFVGALVVFAGFLVLLDAAVYFITDYFAPDAPLWLSATIIGGIVTSIGLVVVLKARSGLDADNLTPHRTVRSLARDTDLLKEKIQ